MQIRDRYIDAFNRIRRRHGEACSGYEIRANCSLREAIDYTRRYIVENDQSHYRYDYYQREFDRFLRHMVFDDKINKILHLDIGCGPGLFTWVMRDYLLSQHGRKDDSVDFIGYDHAENMIRLSNLFLKNFPIAYKYNWCGYFKIRSLEKFLRYKKSPTCDVFVTFGHVLIQNRLNIEAMWQFSRIIAHLFPWNSCHLIAVDAHSQGRPEEFRDACGRLRNALSGRGAVFDYASCYKSAMYARLRRGR